MEEVFHIRTVSIQKACEIMRNAGVPMSLEAMQAGLRQGKFDFGLAIQLKEWKYIIYEKPFIEYIRRVAD